MKSWFRAGMWTLKSAWGFQCLSTTSVISLSTMLATCSCLDHSAIKRSICPHTHHRLRQLYSSKRQNDGMTWRLAITCGLTHTTVLVYIDCLYIHIIVAYCVYIFLYSRFTGHFSNVCPCSDWKLQFYAYYFLCCVLALLIAVHAVMHRHKNLQLYTSCPIY